MQFITFIIPSIGRTSLKDSIESLLLQIDENWNAIIIFDGIKKNIEITDNRIKYIEIDKIGYNGSRNSAGFVRNIGLNIINKLETEWIGFLDDDDYLSNDYICKLKEEILLNKLVDVCIFRMAYQNKYILPTEFDKNINRNRVGISFAIKSYIKDNILFNNNPFEDYFYLKELQNNKYKIIISTYVTYFIKTKPFICKKFPKVLINF
jgi:hypothetical protein